MPAAAHAPSEPAGTPLAEEHALGENGDSAFSLPAHASSLAIVGLGGSAGSIEPLQEFFAQMPADSGLAFVVVLHLSPDHESSLAEILQRRTSMPVMQVTARTQLQANRVYVIPPAKQLIMEDGHVSLAEFERERGRRTTVDIFFRSLANMHGPNSVAIVFSGADSDGAIGIRRVKERGGLTIAQSPDECQQPSMPRFAIATGVVDLVLPAAEMPRRLLDFRAHGQQFQLSNFVERALRDSEDKADGESALRDILKVLRTHTGRDFNGYKRGTILRRIARRMQVNGLGELAGYCQLLRTSAPERKTLLQDLLISVTNFFRDPEVFEQLAATLPEIFRDKGPAHTVRVWVPGCATGEEAYSIAMLLSEHAEQMDAPPQLQVFATDIDEAALVTARLAQYPAAIVADVSEERLKRFFTKTKDHYRVAQPVREMVLFAVQDLLRDAPFSRLDLISCRNVLIYLNRESQHRVFDIFHFALRSEGHLLLGTSEAADDAGALFSPLNKKLRFYRRLPGERMGLPNFVRPAAATPAGQAPEIRGERILLPKPAGRRPAPGQTPPVPEARSISAPELHAKLIERFAPPSLVVNQEHQVVHLSRNVGRFLQFPDGELQRDVLQLVHPMLRLELRTALFRATQEDRTVRLGDVPVDFEGARRLVDIAVRTAPDLAPGYLLIELHERDPAQPEVEPPPRPSGSEDVVQSLEQELELVKRNLQVSREEHGSTTEEMRASNEELHAMNEELRSASEELETGREELQSINEELVTVNQDLKIKVEQLARANSDTLNLMVATNVATVFLDKELCILRYTPPAVALFHLIGSDLGRPLADLRHRLEFDTVIADAEAVLKAFKPMERETRTADGRWFLARTTAYRNATDDVEGVVLSFVDISRVKAAEDALRESEARFRSIIDQTAAGLCLANLDGVITFANPQLGLMLNAPVDSLVGQKIGELFAPPPSDQDRDILSRLAVLGEPIDFERCLFRRDSAAVWAKISIAAMTDQAGRPTSCVAAFVDISRRWQAEESLLRSQEELQGRVRERTDELSTSNLALRAEMTQRRAAESDREQMMRLLVSAQEADRGRISRELHDEIGQHVTALLFGLKALEKDVRDKPEAATTLASLYAIAENVGRDIHQAAMELRPTALDDLGLVRALTAFLEDWAARSQLEIEFDHAEFGEQRLREEFETTIYRVVCEAVHNAIKHAGAKRISVILQRKDDRFVGTVEDNGAGFDVSAAQPSAARSTLGITGMRERVALLRGELTIESEPGGGTMVMVRLPLPKDEDRK